MKLSNLKNKTKVKLITAGKTKSYAKRAISMLLCILMVFSIIPISVLSNMASAADAVQSGQAKISKIGTYAGYTCQDIYYAKNCTIKPFISGNAGAGSVESPNNGEVSLMEKVIKEKSSDAHICNTSTPIYRVWRAGGFSDDNMSAITIATDAVPNAGKLKSTCNTYISANKVNTVSLTKSKAEMIIKVLQYGFRQHTNSVNNGRTYDDMMYFAATQILIWEIQEGKRVNYNVGSGFCSAGSSWWNKNPSYWYGYWHTIYNQWHSKDSDATDYYALILNTCKTVDEASYEFYANNSTNTGVASSTSSGYMGKGDTIPTRGMVHMNNGKWAKEIDFGQGFVTSGAYNYVINGAYNVNWVVYYATRWTGNTYENVKEKVTVYRNPVARQFKGIDTRYADEYTKTLDAKTDFKVLGKTINGAYYYVEMANDTSDRWFIPSENVALKNTKFDFTPYTAAGKNIPGTAINGNVSSNKVVFVSTLPFSTEDIEGESDSIGLKILAANFVRKGFNNVTYLKGGQMAKQGFICGGNSDRILYYLKFKTTAGPNDVYVKENGITISNPTFCTDADKDGKYRNARQTVTVKFGNQGGAAISNIPMCIRIKSDEICNIQTDISSNVATVVDEMKMTGFTYKGLIKKSNSEVIIYGTMSLAKDEIRDVTFDLLPNSWFSDGLSAWNANFEITAQINAGSKTGGAEVTDLAGINRLFNETTYSNNERTKSFIVPIYDTSEGNLSVDNISIYDENGEPEYDTSLEENSGYLKDTKNVLVEMSNTAIEAQNDIPVKFVIESSSKNNGSKKASNNFDISNISENFVENNRVVSENKITIEGTMSFSASANGYVLSKQNVSFQLNDNSVNALSTEYTVSVYLNGGNDGNHKMLSINGKDVDESNYTDNEMMASVLLTLEQKNDLAISVSTQAKDGKAENGETVNGTIIIKNNGNAAVSLSDGIEWYVGTNDAKSVKENGFDSLSDWYALGNVVQETTYNTTVSDGYLDAGESIEYSFSYIQGEKDNTVYAYVNGGNEECRESEPEFKEISYDNNMASCEVKSLVFEDYGVTFYSDKEYMSPGGSVTVVALFSKTLPISDETTANPYYYLSFALSGTEDYKAKPARCTDDKISKILQNNNVDIDSVSLSATCSVSGSSSASGTLDFGTDKNLCAVAFTLSVSGNEVSALDKDMNLLVCGSINLKESFISAYLNEINNDTDSDIFTRENVEKYLYNYGSAISAKYVKEQGKFDTNAKYGNNVSLVSFFVKSNNIRIKFVDAEGNQISSLSNGLDNIVQVALPNTYKDISSFYNESDLSESSAVMTSHWSNTLSNTVNLKINQLLVQKLNGSVSLSFQSGTVNYLFNKEMGDIGTESGEKVEPYEKIETSIEGNDESYNEWKVNSSFWETDGKSIDDEDKLNGPEYIYYRISDLRPGTTYELGLRGAKALGLSVVDTDYNTVESIELKTDSIKFETPNKSSEVLIKVPTEYRNGYSKTNTVTNLNKAFNNESEDNKTAITLKQLVFPVSDEYSNIEGKVCSFEYPNDSNIAEITVTINGKGNDVNIDLQNEGIGMSGFLDEYTGESNFPLSWSLWWKGTKTGLYSQSPSWVQVGEFYREPNENYISFDHLPEGIYRIESDWTYNVIPYQSDYDNSALKAFDKNYEQRIDAGEFVYSATGDDLHKTDIYSQAVNKYSWVSPELYLNVNVEPLATYTISVDRGIYDEKIMLENSKQSALSNSSTYPVDEKTGSHNYPFEISNLVLENCGTVKLTYNEDHTKVTFTTPSNASNAKVYIKAEKYNAGGLAYYCNLSETDFINQSAFLVLKRDTENNGYWDTNWCSIENLNPDENGYSDSLYAVDHTTGYLDLIGKKEYTSNLTLRYRNVYDLSSSVNVVNDSTKNNNLIMTAKISNNSPFDLQYFVANTFVSDDNGQYLFEGKKYDLLENEVYTNEISSYSSDTFTINFTKEYPKYDDGKQRTVRIEVSVPSSYSASGKCSFTDDMEAEYVDPWQIDSAFSDKGTIHYTDIQREYNYKNNISTCSMNFCEGILNVNLLLDTPADLINKQNYGKWSLYKTEKDEDGVYQVAGKELFNNENGDGSYSPTISATGMTKGVYAIRTSSSSTSNSMYGYKYYNTGFNNSNSKIISVKESNSTSYVRPMTIIFSTSFTEKSPKNTMNVEFVEIQNLSTSISTRKEIDTDGKETGNVIIDYSITNNEKHTKDGRTSFTARNVLTQIFVGGRALSFKENPDDEYEMFQGQPFNFFVIKEIKPGETYSGTVTVLNTASSFNKGWVQARIEANCPEEESANLECLYLDLMGNYDDTGEKEILPARNIYNSAGNPIDWLYDVPFEFDYTNNHSEVKFDNGASDMKCRFVNTYGDYTAGTDVITTCELLNPSESLYNNSAKLVGHLTITNSETGEHKTFSSLDTQKEYIVEPQKGTDSYGSNLYWFKWSVPKEWANSSIKMDTYVSSELTDNAEDVSTDLNSLKDGSMFVRDRLTAYYYQGIQLEPNTKYTVHTNRQDQWDVSGYHSANDVVMLYTGTIDADAEYMRINPWTAEDQTFSFITDNSGIMYFMWDTSTGISPETIFSEYLPDMTITTKSTVGGLSTTYVSPAECDSPVYKEIAPNDDSKTPDTKFEKWEPEDSKRTSALEPDVLDGANSLLRNLITSNGADAANTSVAGESLSTSAVAGWEVWKQSEFNQNSLTKKGYTVFNGKDNYWIDTDAHPYDDEIWEDNVSGYKCVDIQLKPNTSYTICTPKMNTGSGKYYAYFKIGSKSYWFHHATSTSLNSTLKEITTDSTGKLSFYFAPTWKYTKVKFDLLNQIMSGASIICNDNTSSQKNYLDEAYLTTTSNWHRLYSGKENYWVDLSEPDSIVWNTVSGGYKRTTIKLKPNTKYLFLAPNVNDGSDAYYYEATGKDFTGKYYAYFKIGSKSYWLHHATSTSLNSTLKEITTDDTGNIDFYFSPPWDSTKACYELLRDVMESAAIVEDDGNKVNANRSSNYRFIDIPLKANTKYVFSVPNIMLLKNSDYAHFVSFSTYSGSSTSTSSDYWLYSPIAESNCNEFITFVTGSDPYIRIQASGMDTAEMRKTVIDAFAGASICYANDGNAGINVDSNKMITKTGVDDNGNTIIASGYGAVYELDSSASFLSTSAGVNETMIAGAESTSSRIYVPSYAKVKYLWSEYGYSTAVGECDTVESLNNTIAHYTPLWYPDGNYTAYAEYEDVWTPAGKCSIILKNDTVQIKDAFVNKWHLNSYEHNTFTSIND